jgi:hypothetical protein
MYLKNLSLTNFKCFMHQDLSLSKLTILLGANSTGKSSLIYGLLLALQSDEFPITLSVNGPLANLGDFRAISYRHRTDHNVGISLIFTEHQLRTVHLDALFTQSLRTGMPVLLSGELGDQAFNVRINKDSRYRAEWTYDETKDPVQQARKSGNTRKFFEALAKFLNEIPRDTHKGSLPKKESYDYLLSHPPPTGSFSFNSRSEFLKYLTAPRYISLYHHMLHIANTPSEFQKTFNYLGSFRVEPQRTYYSVSRGDLKVRRDGANYVEQIAQWEEQRAPQLQQLKQSLRKLGLLTNLRTSRLRGGIFEVKVRTPMSAVPVSLADVGFGVGQLLPVLVADFQLPKEGTLAVSQPEIHLHPSVQADLADHFVRRALKTNNRYIIETHSEYFINRLRLLVAQGKIPTQDLAIVYLNTDGSRTYSHTIIFNPGGQIEGAPKDFFQTYMSDVMNIALTRTK